MGDHGPPAGQQQPCVIVTPMAVGSHFDAGSSKETVSKTGLNVMHRSSAPPNSRSCIINHELTIKAVRGFMGPVTCHEALSPLSPGRSSKMSPCNSVPSPGYNAE